MQLRLSHLNTSRLHPNVLVAFAMIAWWIMNILQGAMMELADDEAYYWSWVFAPGGSLQWGYYDHPPMVAVLIWLSEWIGGELGVRLAATTLLPLGLYLLWTLIRPKVPSLTQALTYCAICFAMPPLQLYGLLALPDAPLLFFSILFLWAFVHYAQNPSVRNALITGIAMALLGYSKYHGVLVVACCWLAQYRLFRKPQTYWAFALALLLYLPHLYWQYQHQFATIAYHLADRHKGFDINNPLQFCVNILLFFNPLLVYAIVKSWRPASTDNDDLMPKLSRWIIAGVCGFFFVASFRGSTQAQWILPAILGIVSLLFYNNPKPNKTLKILLAISAVVMVAVRVLVILNPTNIKGQLWNNKESYQAIAQMAHGNAVQFSGYTQAAKYTFYTGELSSCVPVYYGRLSQWDYNQTDTLMIGQPIIAESQDSPYAQQLPLPNGRIFNYTTVQQYFPIRNIRLIPLSAQQISFDTLLVSVSIDNPYPCAIHTTTSDTLMVGYHVYVHQHYQPSRYALLRDTIPPHGTITQKFHIPIVHDIPQGCYPIGFTVKHKQYTPPIQSLTYPLQVSANGQWSVSTTR
ncbi:MAG: glycosyltransferase family 39 protein [Bacteroidales bacterium]|nr:glycosyltransferase family 39 protein [Candidatus Colimorpha onthohippi]